MRIKRNFKTNMMLFSAALVLLVLLIQLLFTQFFSKMYYISYNKKAVENLFREIQSDYTDDIYDIYNSIEKAVDINNLSILIFNERELIFSNRNTSIPGLTWSFIEMGPSEWKKFSENPVAFFGKSKDESSENIILTGKFMYQNSERYVVIESPIESIDSSIAVLTRVNLMISGGVLLLAIIAAYIMARHFSEPIENAEKVADNVANLDFSMRADENVSVMELANLATSINLMSDNLKQLIGDLTAANTQLKKDISHQRRLDKMRREFISNVSHELKTPLFLLLMYSENLKNNAESIDKDYYLDTIIEEVHRMDKMVKGLLNISLIENNLADMNMAEVDLSTLATSLLLKTEVMFDRHKLSYHIDEGLLVLGDNTYLENAMNNFLINAKSHTAENDRIYVSLRRDGDGVLFDVYNQGKSIAEEEIDRIWESFYRADKARVRTNENHSGLGLYIVKTIVEAHGGNCGVENVADGVRFWLRLNLDHSEVMRIQLTQDSILYADEAFTNEAGQVKKDGVVNVNAVLLSEDRKHIYKTPKGFLNAKKADSVLWKTKIIDHRGNHQNYPENSIPAFENSLSEGVEADIRLTSDRYWVVIHDDTLDRTTNGNGRVENSSIADLQKATLISKDEKEAKEQVSLHIPVLDEFIRICHAQNKTPFIEIKPLPGKVIASDYDQLATSLRRYDLENRAVIISFYEDHLIEMRKRLKNVNVLWLVKHLADKGLEKMKELGDYSGINVNWQDEQLSAEKIKAIQEEGLLVGVWTVPEAEIDRFKNWNVDFITTDDGTALAQLTENDS